MPKRQPIETLFAYRHFSPNVRARIRKIHPDGIAPGERIRGWFPKPTSWRKARKQIKRGRIPGYFRRRGNRGVWDISMGRFPPYESP